MCTSIADKKAISGSGKGPEGWFTLSHVYVGYDHPVHAPLEHAIQIDLVNESSRSRLAVELTRDAARDLAVSILEAIDAADDYEGDLSP